MSHFVYNNLDLPADKVNSDGFANPVTNPTKRWSANDAVRVFQALKDVRDALASEHANVKSFGAIGDGITNDTAAIQSAINATQGIPLYFPKGKYKVTSTLQLTGSSHRLIGDFSNRNVDGGTEISYTGTGPCIQIGLEDLVNSPDWTTNWYGGASGTQEHRFEYLCITHGAPDTALVSSGSVNPAFKTGAYGIWDWYNGQIVFEHMRFEGFEASFAGIQSDLNIFNYVVSLRSKFGLYIGPRSDQQSIRDLYSFFCDRAVTVDGANDVQIECPKLVACGHSTASPVEVRRGSVRVDIIRPWLEHLTGAGYQGTDQQSFVSAGEVNGYGSGGSIQSPGGTPNTNPADTVTIQHPLVETVLSGNAGHTNAIATVGKCKTFLLDEPAARSGTNLSNFDTMVSVPAAQAPSSSDTQIFVDKVESSTTLAKIVTIGGGTPAVAIRTLGSSGFISYTTNRHQFAKIGDPTGSEIFQLSQEGQAGDWFVIAPTYTGGQTERLRLGRHMGTFAKAAAPSTGTYERGDWKRINDPSEGDYMAWVCITAGTPGTWRKAGLITQSNGFVVNDILQAAKSFRVNELSPAQITANQNNYAPTNFVDAVVVILTSDAARDITGFGSPGNNRTFWAYNDGAFNITLKHLNGGSTAANQIIGRGNADVVLTPATGVQLYYSTSKTKWLCLGDTL